MKNEYSKFLTEKVLPLYIKLTPDYECGGMFTEFNSDGSVATTDKNVWFMGRGLWSYAMTYRLVEPRAEYLDMCARGFEFLVRCELPDGRLPYRVTRCAEPLEVRELYFYAEIFAAMGCAQYYRVSGREDVKKKAEQYFEIVARRYREQKGKNQTIKAPAPCTCFGLHMATLSAAQFVRSGNIMTELCDEIAAECVEAMKEGGYVNDSLKMVIEYQALPGEHIELSDNHTCPGHVFEGAWFVLTEGLYRNDRDMIEFGKKLADYAMPHGFEKKTLLIPTYILPTEPDNFDTTDTLLGWPPNEAVCTYRVLYEIFGDEKYLKLASLIEKEFWRYFIDRNRSYRFINKGDKPVAERTDKGSFIQGPFHLERMLLALSVQEDSGSVIGYMQ